MSKKDSLFFNDTATTEIYTLSLHDALPISTTTTTYVFTRWLDSSFITTGLPDIGDSSAPTVFELSGDTYMISGEGSGVFNGFIWNTGTSQWDVSAFIVTGLPTIVYNCAPTVFDIGTDTYLIAGNLYGVSTGFKWNTGTSQWDADTPITTGIPDIGGYAIPTVFSLNSEKYLIIGESTGGYNGYIWNTGTSQWDASSSILVGLVDVASYSSPAVFNFGSDKYIIVGAYAGDFTGFKWNTGTNQWDANAAITTGLTNIDLYSNPSIFTLLGERYLISGGFTGNFFGWIASDVAFTTTTTTVAVTTTTTTII